MKKLLLPALAILALASCNNEEIQTIDEPVAVSFGQSLNLYATTKAPITGDKLVSTTIGVWGAEYTETSAWVGAGEKNFMDNEKFNVGADGTITYDAATPKYYSIVAGTKYDFYAYSPIADKATNGIEAPADNNGALPTLAVTLNNTKVADQVDILWANVTAQTKNTAAIALGFKHALAQLVFKVQKEAGVTADVVKKISVQANSTATMSLVDGKFTSVATKVPFTVYEDVTGQTVTTDATLIGSPLMLFPEVPGDITFTIGDKDYTFTPAVKTLVANKITTITVTVKETAVSFSQSAIDWTEDADNAGTGTIE